MCCTLIIYNLHLSTQRRLDLHLPWGLVSTWMVVCIPSQQFHPTTPMYPCTWWTSCGCWCSRWRCTCPPRWRRSRGRRSPRRRSAARTVLYSTAQYRTVQYSTVPGAGTAGGRAAGWRPSASAGTPPPPAQSSRGYRHQTPGGSNILLLPTVA